ncbi:hypothetical protein A8B78_02810 [Jannaschia sp. EhC01]|nr:hypothetical protein A8B78_02810 [Jannaschia sp. EhC01]
MTDKIYLFSDDAPERSFQRMRKGMFWAGVVMIALGVAALAVPWVTSLVVSIFIGWLLAIAGIASMIGSMALRGTGLFAWQVLAGLASFVAGLLLLIYPAQGLVALTALVALVLLLTGAAQGAFAFWMRPLPGWIWGLLSALVSIVLGVVILASLPEASAIVLGIFVGIDFLSTGLALVLIARSVA